MASIKSLVGKKMSVKTKFMDVDVEIHKLSTADVLLIQELSKQIEGDESKGLDVMKTVIKAGVSDGADLTDDDFNSWPLDELGKLSNAIMKHSGLGQAEGNVA